MTWRGNKCSESALVPIATANAMRNGCSIKWIFSHVVAKCFSLSSSSLYFPIHAFVPFCLKTRRISCPVYISFLLRWFRRTQNVIFIQLHFLLGQQQPASRWDTAEIPGPLSSYSLEVAVRPEEKQNNDIIVRSEPISNISCCVHRFHVIRMVQTPLTSLSSRASKLGNGRKLVHRWRSYQWVAFGFVVLYRLVAYSCMLLQSYRFNAIFPMIEYQFSNSIPFPIPLMLVLEAKNQRTLLRFVHIPM